MPRTKQFDQEEVLQKAKNLFWKQGYHATSVQDLVDNLGINRASLYAAFGGKNQLYEAAFAAYRAENRAGLEQRLAEFDSPKEALQTVFTEALTESLADEDKKGCFVVNCTTEYLPQHRHILVNLLENKATFQRIIGKALERGKAIGEFSEEMNTAEVAAYLYTFFSGLKVIAKIEDDPQQIRNIIATGLKVLQ